MTPRPALGYALVLAAASLFAVNAGVSRVPLRSGTDIETFTSVRVTGALALLALIALLTERSAFRLPRGRQVALVIGLGLVGVALGLIGLIATWNAGLGPRWYPVSLVVLAVPPCWLGGKLHELRAGRG